VVPQENSVFEHYYSADLDAGLEPAICRLEGKRFDRVLLLDVLEHLRSPERILDECHRVLKPEGRIIVSLPNVANIAVRLALFAGRFDYQERGILDRTHLRFFTRKTARRLLESAGYAIVTERETVIPIELILGMSPDSLALRILNGLSAAVTRLLPGLFGYQIMFVARSAKPDSSL